MAHESKMMEINSDVLHECSKMTLAYLGIYTACILYQVVVKLKHTFSSMKSKNNFNRYTDDRMVVVDRIVGNMLEWAPVYMGLSWMSMFLTNGETANYGWLYVYCRAAFPIIASLGGLNKGGAQIYMWLCTMPSYYALVRMFIAVYFKVNSA